MSDYMITEYDELLPRAEAERHGHKVVRYPTDAEIVEYEKEERSLREQGRQQQHGGSYHELPD